MAVIITDSDLDRSMVSMTSDVVVLYRNPVNIGVLEKYYPTIAQLREIFRLYDLLPQPLVHAGTSQSDQTLAIQMEHLVGGGFVPLPQAIADVVK